MNECASALSMSDPLQVECEDIGPLQKIRIGHDNAGMGSAWFLDKVGPHLSPPAAFLLQGRPSAPARL